jgi:cytochrome c peroxidase
MRVDWRVVAILALAGWVSACAAERLPLWESDNPIQPLPPPPVGIDLRLATLPDPPVPERIRLGRWLFFDARLSEDRAQACAGCHRPDHGFSDPEPVSRFGNGLRTKRKALSLVNGAWGPAGAFYWDGRASSLEAQAVGATEDPIVTGGLHQAQTMVEALAELGVYKRYFREAYGTADVTPERVAKALADFERTIMSGDSAWDRWKHTGDQGAVDAVAKAGDALFFGKAGCASCHSGDVFTDRRFHNLGVGWKAGSEAFADDGRFAVTKQAADRGAFRTPTLRDVAKHAPYMHDGSVVTLREAIEWHLRGGRPNPGLDPLLRPVDLSGAEVAALVRFLESLSSLQPPDTGPATFPR